MATASAPIARQAAPKGWLATFLVLVIMLAIVIGGLIAAGSVASLPDKPITLAGGVTLPIPPEWSLAGKTSDGTVALLTRGNASVGITVKADSSQTAALEQLRNEWSGLGTVTVGEIAAVSDLRSDGKPTARFAYSGIFPDDGLPGTVEGEVTGVQGSNNVAVLFDAWAGEGDFLRARDDVATIIRSTNIP